MRDGKPYDVFHSHSRGVSAATEALRARLRESALSAFLGPYGRPIAQPSKPWLEQQLATRGAMVDLLGPAEFGEWQHRDIELGLDGLASAQ
jgi:hypothetical protein